MSENEAKPFEWQVMERLIKIEEKLDGYVEFKKRFYEAERHIGKVSDDLQDDEKRIEKLEQRNQWIARTAVGAVITSLVGIIFCFVKLGMGI